MADIASITQALSALQQAAEIVKLLRNADAMYEKAELKLRVAELAEALATARFSVLEARSEVEALKQELARMSAESRANIEEREGVYFIREGEKATGPYCPRCYEAEGRRMPLARFTGAFAAIGKYNCPHCKATY